LVLGVVVVASSAAADGGRADAAASVGLRGLLEAQRDVCADGIGES
jgi:hypothetical protein